MRRRRSKSPPIPNGPLDSEMEPTDQGEKLPRIDVCRLYLFFLSARHLHFPAAVYLVLATSVGSFMLSMITGTSYATAVFFPQLAVAFLEIAWFCCFRLAVVVSVKSWKIAFYQEWGLLERIQVAPRRRTKSSEKAMTFSATTNEMQQKTWVFLSTTFPWDSSSAYAARAWILASREHVLVFSEKRALKFAACFGFENAGGQ